MATSRMKKRFFWAAGVGGAIATVLIAGYLMYHETVKETIRDEVLSYIREKASNAVQESGGGEISIAMEEFSYGFFSQVLDIRGIRVRYSDSSAGKGERLDFSVKSASCSGLSPLDVLIGKGLSLGDVLVDEPYVDYRIWDDSATGEEDVPAPDSVYAGLPEVPNLDSLLNTLAIGILPPDIAPLVVDKVHITNATIRDKDDRAEVNYDESFEQVNLLFEAIALGEETEIIASVVDVTEVHVGSWERTMLGELSVHVEGTTVRVDDTDSSLSVDFARYHANSGMQAEIRNVKFSFLEQKIAIDSFDIRPSMTDKEFFASTPYRADRFIVRGSGVELLDIDLNSLTAGEALTVREVVIDTVIVDVFSSLIGPPSPAMLNPEMPSQLFDKIPYDVTVDSINVADATIKFAELHPHNKRPGRLFWSGVASTITGATTIQERQKKAPLTLTATGKFFGVSPMHATIRVPLDTKVYRLQAEGGMGKFDIKLLNNFIPYADNIKIVSGKSTKSSFNISVVGKKSSGWVSPYYSNLEVELVEPESKETNILTDIASWAANTFVVKKDNTAGKDHKQGKVDLTLPSDAAIMQTLWFPIRDGIGDAAGF